MFMFLCQGIQGDLMGIRIKTATNVRSYVYAVLCFLMIFFISFLRRIFQNYLSILQALYYYKIGYSLKHMNSY